MEINLYLYVNNFNFSSFKLHKPKLEVEMTDRLKNEVSTGYVSFL